MPRRFTFSDEVNFLTLTVVDWLDVFTRREYRDFFISCLTHCQKNKGLEVYAYVIMTNHVHLVVQAVGNQHLSAILRDLKSYSSKVLVQQIAAHSGESRKHWMLPIFAQHGRANPVNHHHQFWQNENYPVALINASLMQQKIDYIHWNPVQSGIVNDPHEYLYSSASPLSPLKIDPWQ